MADTDRPPDGPPSDPAGAGRYRILGRLGQEASSVVYEAYDLRHDRVVALKVMRATAGGTGGSGFTPGGP